MTRVLLDIEWVSVIECRVAAVQQLGCNVGGHGPLSGVGACLAAQCTER